MNQSFRELFIWSFLLILPAALLIVAVGAFMMAPARRNERARFFLDLLQTALDTGQSPERAIVAISETRERSVGAHFHLLAAHIEEGATLGDALGRARNFLPVGVAEALRIGAAEQALPKMLPAARAMLNDANSRLRGALHYVVVFLLVMLPASALFLPFLSIYLWPKFQLILQDLEVSPPHLTVAVFENIGWITLGETGFLAVIMLCAFFYVGGPNVGGWMRFFGAWPDRLLLQLPWRRERAQRDFTAVLAILLDAGLKEDRAVELAARASANVVLKRRAAKVISALRAGVDLPEALHKIESGSEFRWRLENALRGGKGFFAALRGWHESLEARAFQSEQAAAHVITTFIVVLNGALVTLVMAAVFLILIAVIDEGVLW
jgi:type II secretory pathway component PulF